MARGKIRIDELLVSRGLFDSVDEARRACFAGEVSSGDVHVTAPSQKVSPDIELNVKSRPRFVSRGGDKLESALEQTGFDPSGMNCIDVGASSGGFTDCLLQHGASRVAAVDVGYADFAWSLRNDPRVSLYERTNIKSVAPEQVGGPFDLLVADLLFISLTSLLPVFLELIRDSGHALIMVKPQFEIERERVEEGGVVRLASEHTEVLEKVVGNMELGGFEVLDLCPSRVPGKKRHNLEFFILARKRADSTDDGLELPGKHVSIDIAGIVNEAHESLGD
ncbi:MAG: TlyA family RNA methyltransferase [Coriobacteriales bacterium]|jgi:23S rRNA (cytidine1920-2'-O)/16S rRNA (cytidine1409-2'-O)-methyltransferase